MSRRTSRTPGSLLGTEQRCQKRRRCDGHIAERHWIEVGEPIFWSALPPGNQDICNDRWLHAAFCSECVPL